MERLRTGGRASGAHGNPRATPPQAGQTGDRAPFSRGRWLEVVCIASGPSLTADDCDAVRRWREEAQPTEEGGRGVIVTNTSFRIAPWADVLYAMDRKWWDFHRAEVAQVFQGELCSHRPRRGVRVVRHPYFRSQGQNSGAGAIAVAHHFGARRVILLGYDCQHTGGRFHWHPDHPRAGGSGNAGSVCKWPAQFQDLARHVPGVNIINCSRETALTIFPRAQLEDML